MTDEAYERFSALDFEGFRRAATDNSLSRYEKIGFPDAYRIGKEELIFNSIRNALSNLNGKGGLVLDIGPGCSDLPNMMIRFCQAHQHQLILVDSAEMLSLLPDAPHVKKISAIYPKCEQLLVTQKGQINAILAYSMLHYVFAEGNLWDFLDSSLELLAEGGEMFIGDIPNVSKRKRFFSSQAGRKFHQQFTQSSSLPEVVFNRLESKLIDDSVVHAIISRARGQGFDAYVMPQPNDLPMANRREDILIRRP